MRLMNLLTGKENFGKQFALLLLSIPPAMMGGGRGGKNRSFLIQEEFRAMHRYFPCKAGEAGKAGNLLRST